MHPITLLHTSIFTLRMEIDITTLNDLSIFNNNQDQSVFDIFNHTRTNGGRAYLQNIYLNPQQEVSKIVDVQKTIQHIIAKQAEWPLSNNQWYYYGYRKIF